MSRGFDFGGVRGNEKKGDDVRMMQENRRNRNREEETKWHHFWPCQKQGMAPPGLRHKQIKTEAKSS